jgi:lysophospholipase L1-like esterase
VRRSVWFALAGVLTLTACSASAASPQGDRAAPKKETARRAAVVFALGDSYTSGIRGTMPEETYMADTARALGWQIVIGGHAGTGFVGQGRVRKNFTKLYDQELAWRPPPDLMLIAGGHNDVAYKPEQVSAAARELLTKVGQRWPRTKVVLIGPMWGGDPTARALKVRDSLREVATASGTPFIDPLEEQWITGSIKKHTGNAARFIRKDGTHPNREGNRYLATRLVAELRDRGLANPAHQGP